jgi:hypothetical protein
MRFPSKDGFPISLDGIIEFRVIPETAAQTYVTYNDVSNDDQGASASAQEIIDKVIMPNARAFCRLRGSNSLAREFIGGDTRTAFQTEFQKAITATQTCDMNKIGSAKDAFVVAQPTLQQSMTLWKIQFESDGGFISVEVSFQFLLANSEDCLGSTRRLRCILGET